MPRGIDNDVTGGERQICREQILTSRATARQGEAQGWTE